MKQSKQMGKSASVALNAGEDQAFVYGQILQQLMSTVFDAPDKIQIQNKNPGSRSPSLVIFNSPC